MADFIIVDEKSQSAVWEDSLVPVFEKSVLSFQHLFQRVVFVGVSGFSFLSQTEFENSFSHNQLNVVPNLKKSDTKCRKALYQY